MNIAALSPAQQTMLEQAIAKSKVVDFGGSDGAVGAWMLRHGAEEVLVIDKEKFEPRKRAAKLSYMFCYFKNIEESLKKYDTAMVCWPPNNEESMRELIFRLLEFPRVIYIGRNDEVNACGMPCLWKYFSTRKLVMVMDDYPHCLIIYGEHGRSPVEQPLVREELAGLNYDKVVV